MLHLPSTRHWVFISLAIPVPLGANCSPVSSTCIINKRLTRPAGAWESWRSCDKPPRYRPCDVPHRQALRARNLLAAEPIALVLPPCLKPFLSLAGITHSGPGYILITPQLWPAIGTGLTPIAAPPVSLNFLQEDRQSSTDALGHIFQACKEAGCCDGVALEASVPFLSAARPRAK